MNNTKLLDNLAMEIEAPRKKRRIKKIKAAFSAYTEFGRVPWWKKCWKRKKS